jgi:hypothetical protein
MKKIITLTNLVFLITLAACDPKPNDPFSMNVALELLLNDHLPEIYRSLLPIEYIMPTQLPSTINDPHLFVAWIYLYNQNDPITIHDGSTLTGRDLAMVVIERSVPVSWGSKLICNGNSCAKRFACENMECVENFKPDEVYPIYISQRYQDTENITLARLAGSLAHELYHYILPFDSVQTSLYEEYWAFYIGAQVEQAKWAIFDPYDPNTAACLMAWFRVHGQKGYFGSDIYPMTLETPVDTTSEVCLP